MVVTLRWIESWTVVIISIAILMLIMIILLSFVCWDKHRSKGRQFVVLDEKGVKRTFSPEISILSITNCDQKPNVFFQPFSITSLKSNLKFFKNNTDEDKSELYRSMEISNAFDHAILQIEANGKDEDVLSCISNDSKQTFYSTYPLVRTLSTAATVKSSTSISDLHT